MLRLPQSIAGLARAASATAVLASATATGAQNQTRAEINGNVQQPHTIDVTAENGPEIERFMAGDAWTPNPIEVMLMFGEDAPGFRITIVSDGLALQDINSNALGNSNLFATLDALFPNGENDYLPVFLNSALNWSDVSGIRFVDEDDVDLAAGMENELTDDDGSAWFSVGPYDSNDPGVQPADPDFGDIRIGMAPLGGDEDDPLYIVTGSNSEVSPAMAGHIVFNSDRAAAQFGSAMRLEHIVTEAIGRALGLRLVCPATGQPVPAMEIAGGFDALMEPGINNSLVEPTTEDIRAIQALYGDASEPNDEFLFATELQGESGLPLSPFDDTASLPLRSLHTVDDTDIYTFAGQELIFTFNISRDGLAGQALSTGSPEEGTCEDSIQGVNTQDLQDLLIQVINNDGNPVPLLNEDGMIVTQLELDADSGDNVNEVEFSVSIPEEATGLWQLVITSDPEDAPGPDTDPALVVQLYSLTATVDNLQDSDVPLRVDDFSELIDDGMDENDGGGINDSILYSSSRLNIRPWSDIPLDKFGIEVPGAQPDDDQPFGLRNDTRRVTGPADLRGQSIDFDAFDPPKQRAVVGVLDFFQPRLQHDTFQGRPDYSAVWGESITGVPPQDAAQRAINDHATAVAGIIGGAPFTSQFTTQGGPEVVEFESVAPDSVLAFGAIGNNLIPDINFGLFSQEAAFYSLFALTDPQIATQDLGMPAAATIINGSVGSGPAEPGFPNSTGDSDFALAIDSIVYTRDVTVVLAAGNSGGLDQRTECVEPDAEPDDPGVMFVGAKTITSPATAFNAIVVGGVGTGVVASGEATADATFTMNALGNMAPTVPPTFPAKGPIDARDWGSEDFTVNTGVRPGIHVIAPASGPVNEELPISGDCFRGRDVRWNLGVPIAGDTAVTDSVGSLRGTSLAAPIVAGAVALMQDFNTLIDAPSFHSSPLVMKACIINSGFKLEGWSNNGEPGMPADPEAERSEEDTDDFDLWDAPTEQGLDFAQGSGWLSFRILFEQFVAAAEDEEITRDVEFTFHNRSVVRRVAGNEAPSGGNLTAAYDDATQLATDEKRESEFPAIEQRGPSPFEMRDRLALGTGHTTEYHLLADTGDIPFGTGGGGATVPTGGTRIVTGGASAGPFPNIPIPGPPSNTNNAEVPIRFEQPFPVHKTGWDIGKLGSRNVEGFADRIGYIDYIIPNAQAGETITATLVWNRRVVMRAPNFNSANPDTSAMLLRELELENLDLRLFIAGGVDEAAVPIASSTTTFNNVEHITRQLFEDEVPPGGVNLILRVEWAGTEYDFFNNGEPADVPFALAWRTSPNEMGVRAQEGTLFDSFDAGGNRATASHNNAFFQNLVEIVFSYGSRAYHDDNYKRRADINNDGRVDFSDLNEMLNNM